MKIKLPLFGILLLAASLTAADAEKPARRPANAGGGIRQLAGGAGPGGPGGGIERVLTDEQRQKLREAMQEQGGDFRENMQQLAELRRELNEAVLDGKADAKFIKEKTDAIAKLDAEQ